MRPAPFTALFTGPRPRPTPTPTPTEARPQASELDFHAQMHADTVCLERIHPRFHDRSHADTLVEPLCRIAVIEIELNPAASRSARPLETVLEQAFTDPSAPGLRRRRQVLQVIGVGWHRRNDETAIFEPAHQFAELSFGQKRLRDAHERQGVCVLGRAIKTEFERNGLTFEIGNHRVHMRKQALALRPMVTEMAHRASLVMGMHVAKNMGVGRIEQLARQRWAKILDLRRPQPDAFCRRLHACSPRHARHLPLRSVMASASATLGLCAGAGHYPDTGRMGETKMIEITNDGAVRVLALNRPEVLNAFNGDLFDTLVESLLEADADASVAVVVITGTGRAFTAGADLSEMGQRGAPPKHGFAGLCETLIAYGKPVIVAANGASVGVGGTIMGLVDVVYVADSAKVRCPFAALGINPEAGSSLTFPALMGAQKAAWFLYSAEVLDAGACVEAGLALEQLPDEGFLDHVLARARTLASKAPNSLRETKELLWAPRRDALRAAMAAENEALTRTIGSAENKEAIAAFQEKRAPDFRRSA